MDNLTNNQYFSSLPIHIQEAVMQSGLDFYNEEELRQFVSKLETSEM